MTYLVEHNIRMPVRRRDGAGKGELEWSFPSRPTLLNFFANPIYVGVYAYGVRAVERQSKSQAIPGTDTDRRAPTRPSFFARSVARLHQLRAL